MEIFLDVLKTKNNRELLVCGICKHGMKDLCANGYKTKMLDIDFSDTRDEFFLDFSMMNCIVSCSDKAVIAVGASMHQDGVVNRSGGIIGNPFDDKHSNDDEMEEILPDLFCVGFPGRVGFVFKSNAENAVLIKNEVQAVLDNDNSDIVKIAKSILDKRTDFYILVSDGSGKGSYPYVCGRDKENFYEKRLTH